MDPTFNLEEFSVTPTVYRHLLLHNPHTKQSPLLLSPILVHQRKQFYSYNYFSSTLNGLTQELTSVKPIGTDGEKKIVNVAICYFSQYDAPGTFSKTLNSIFVKSSPPPPHPTVSNLLIGDIIWIYQPRWHIPWGVGWQQGCTNIWCSQLNDLKEKWDCYEHQAFTDLKSHNPGFHLWFSCFKTAIAHCVLLGKILGVAVLQNHFIQMIVIMSPLMLSLSNHMVTKSISGASLTAR